METIKVNMTPCEDVQTIHASQNGGEARQWEFELHNNGELIDTSEITEQLFFKAYKGGTEQLLPENGSTPTTSPFKGDIKYPQGLLSDQEFTYRQSPTEEDGLAKITDIKGNTLVWNQLWDYENISFQQGLTVTKPGNGVYLINGTRSTSVSGDAYNILKAGHKYLIKSNTDNGTIVVTNSITWQTTQATYILNATADGTVTYFINPGTYTNVKFIPQVIDLTQMFGSGNEPTTVEEFTSLFPLSYYSYNQGSLLSFNSNGIKTVGKNQSQLVSMSTISGGYINASSGDIATVKKGITYTLSFDNLTTSTANIVARILANGTWIRQGENNLVANSRWALTFTATDDGVLGLSAGLGSQYSQVKVFDNIQLEFGSSATSYEPYTSSTLSLPISTYFPTGMKSAGNVYDELTESKAITRVGEVDLGTLSWSYVSANRRFVAIISDAKSSSSLTTLENIVCARYENVTWENILTQAKDKIISLHYTSNNSYVAVIDNDYSDATAFKTAMSGVYLCYELATPTETSFTTASLVTENAEIPLSNNDGTLIGKCTEELSAEPGFHDAKIKLSDADGDVYSNKIQLHVERSPQ